MGRLRLLRSRGLVRLANFRGFVIVRPRGSHALYKHPDGRWVTIPMHAKLVGKGLTAKIIKDKEVIDG